MIDKDTGRISLKIDLSSGTIQIDAPADEFSDIVDKAKELLGQIPASTTVSSTRVPTSEAAPKDASPSGSVIERGAKARSTRTAGGSQARVGRIGSFEPVDLGLSEAQERDLRAFMQEKNPKEQAEQVAVALYKGEQLMERRGFGYNEIYSLMRLAGVRDLPKALDVIIGRMIDSQWVVREGRQQFALKFVGRDHVEQNVGKTE